ncbi:MAG: DinB family protein [Acidobacteria bacterium]|nr:DinB family protein [Acidobacteriota bacterium]HQZ40918.1 DinB family protein [Vicinamibacterales bacterium]
MNAYGARQMAESFRTVRKNTVQVAQDIPDDKYAFRAVEGAMTVAGMLAHLATSTHWVTQVHFVEKKGEVSYEDFGRYMAEGKAAAEALTTKADIIAALESHGRDFASALETMTDAQLAEHVKFPAPIQPPSKSRFEMLLSVKEHEMHHRGQLMLMERILGIVPHLTRARQNR